MRFAFAFLLARFRSLPALSLTVRFLSPAGVAGPVGGEGNESAVAGRPGAFYSLVFLLCFVIRSIGFFVFLPPLHFDRLLFFSVCCSGRGESDLFALSRGLLLSLSLGPSFSFL